MTDLSIPQKRCTKCGEPFPETPEFFRPAKGYKNGLNSQCRDCERAYHRQYQQDYMPSPCPEGHKRCGVCNRCLPVTDGYFPRNRHNGFTKHCHECIGHARQRDRRYRARNPEAARAQEREHYRKNRQHILARRRRHYAATIEHQRRYRRDYNANNPERMSAARRRSYAKHRDKRRKEQRERYWKQPERHIQVSRAWKAANPDKVAATRRRWQIKNQEHVRERARRYSQLHPEKARANARRRRSLARSLPDTLSHAVWLRLMAYWGDKCAVCGRPAGLWHHITQDHWIPMADTSCPGTVPSNIVPLCHGVGGCNNSKNDRPADLWLLGRLGKTKGRRKLREITQYLAWASQFD